MLAKALAGVLVIFIATGAGVAGAGYFQIPVPTPVPIPGGGEPEPAIADIPDEEIEPPEPGKPRTLLVLGSDRRAKNSIDNKLSGQSESPHSDTIVLIRLDPKRNRIAVLSLPRDLAVTIPGYADNTKINEAYDEGGAAKTLETVKYLFESATGAKFPVNSVIDVNFNGFQQAVNYVKGVYVDVDRDYNNPEGTGFAAIDVKAGYQRLVGSDALAYVRYRHTDSDIFRNARQQDFLRQASNQQAVEKLKSYGEASDFMSQMLAYFRFDKKFMTRKNIAGLLKTGVSLGYNHAPVNQIALQGITDAPDPEEDTRLYISTENIRAAYDEFMTGEGTRNPKREKKVKKVKKPAKASSITGLENARRLGEDMAVLATPRLKKLPFYFPEYRTTGSTLRQRHPARVLPARREGRAAPRLPDRDLQRRPRRVLRRPGPDVARSAAARQPRPHPRDQRPQAAALLRRHETAPGGLAHPARRVLGDQHAQSQDHERADARHRRFAAAFGLQVAAVTATPAAAPGYDALMLRIVSAVLLTLLLVPAAASAACPGADPCPYSAVGVVGQRAEGVLRFPQASAVGPDGSVYVADQYTHAIQVFGPDGAFRRELGAAGSGPGGLTSVGAVAVAPDGSVYVADGADRIDRFAADGSILNSWGSSGSAPGQFRFGAGGGNDSGAGGGIAIGPDGSVYVADTRNDRIQRFAADGTSPVVIVPKGDVERPQGLAVKGSRLIVADNWRHQLAVYDTGGKLIRRVGDGEGAEPNQFFHPYDVAIDPAGRVYVADNSNHRIVRYGPAPTYKYRARWGAFGTRKGQLQYPRGLAVDAIGRTFVADPGGNRIDVFDIGGASLGSFGASGRAAGQFIRPLGVGADAGGTRAVADSVNGRIVLLNPGGDVAAMYGAPAPGPTLLPAPVAVAFDAAGRVYVLDQQRARVLVFDRAGKIIRTIGSRGSGAGQAAGAVGAGGVRGRDALRRRHRQRADRPVQRRWQAPRLLRALPRDPRHRGVPGRQPRVRRGRGDQPHHGVDRHGRGPGGDRLDRLGGGPIALARRDRGGRSGQPVGRRSRQ